MAIYFVPLLLMALASGQKQQQRVVGAWKALNDTNSVALSEVASYPFRSWNSTCDNAKVTILSGSSQVIAGIKYKFNVHAICTASADDFFEGDFVIHISTLVNAKHVVELCMRDSENWLAINNDHGQECESPSVRNSFKVLMARSIGSNETTSEGFLDDLVRGMDSKMIACLIGGSAACALLVIVLVVMLAKNSSKSELSRAHESTPKSTKALMDSTKAVKNGHGFSTESSHSDDEVDEVLEVL